MKFAAVCTQFGTIDCFGKYLWNFLYEALCET